jgi:hypothetical protein
LNRYARPVPLLCARERARVCVCVCVCVCVIIYLGHKVLVRVYVCMYVYTWKDLDTRSSFVVKCARQLPHA